MIVLHVARARTDSINIRGSLGKTRDALWITGATFLYFSGCNAHTPFTLFPFLRLSRLLPVISVALLPFHDLSLPVRHRSPFLSFTRTPYCHFSLPFTHAVVFFAPLFLSFILDSSLPTIPLVEQMETRHSRTVSLLRIVTLSTEMETVPVSYSRLPYSRN